MPQTLSRQPLALDEVILVNVKLAALYAQRTTLVETYDIAYERWLSYAGSRPSRNRYEDALHACHELTPFEAALAAAEADTR